MDALAQRVAARYLQASLVQNLQSQMMRFLSKEPLSVSEGKEIGLWLEAHFQISNPKTPKGQKALKDLAQKLLWWLLHGLSASLNPRETIEHTWKAIEPHLGDLAKHFSEEGGTVIPKKLQIGGHTFTNGVGLDEKKLATYAGRLASIFDELRGWRRKALDGGVQVLLASPKDFGGGTAGGKYRSGTDTLLIRTTPSVLKREGKSYAGFEYIIVHELGHRYEHKHHVPVDFDRSEWWTTPYSKKEGEGFAELFALTNFGITSAHTTWDPSINGKFDSLMGG